MTRPGLAKARGLPLVLARRGTLVRVAGPRWRELFDGADVVSEGSVRKGPSGRVWYGSTSLILTVAGDQGPLVAAVAARDVHVRLMALRVACREACVRAPGLLGRLSSEITVRAEPRGVRIDVDVQAPLIERRARTGAT